jgi:uncharacterized membrane protein YbhN (UPF0104 family)
MLLLAGAALPCAFAFTLRQPHVGAHQSFSLSAVWSAMRHSNPMLLGIAVALTYLGYLLRTWRWCLLMTPRGHFDRVFKGTILGFTGVALLGRVGETVRPAYISRKERSPFAEQLAIWLLERALDALSVLLLILLDLLLSPRVRLLVTQKSLHRVISHGGLAFMIAAAGITALLPAL